MLLVVDAAGGTVNGRTAMQKLCYFGSAVIEQDSGHRAHYYGPYSRPVEDAVSNSAFAGDITETVTPFASGPGRQYHYELTPQGRETVTELRAAHAGAAYRIDETVKRLGELVPGYRQKPLSLAAKVDLIVRQHDTPVDTSDVPTLARDLGWQVDEGDVKTAVSILLGLGRIAEVQTNPRS
ncbi:hypothetical protein [Patulibacter sp. SYSU D01012]|uniref:hypothetical protein n=1 Tax=Patulibacter sp. SYSU D01012 TaxID=2817381 RepID=UPI001B3158EA|nr:hypothetical protein [Patulibacter sp. SYSU D01012]